MPAQRHVIGAGEPVEVGARRLAVDFGRVQLLPRPRRQRDGRGDQHVVAGEEMLPVPVDARLRREAARRVLQRSSAALPRHWRAHSGRHPAGGSRTFSMGGEEADGAQHLEGLVAPCNRASASSASPKRWRNGPGCYREGLAHQFSRRGEAEIDVSATRSDGKVDRRRGGSASARRAPPACVQRGGERVHRIVGRHGDSSRPRSGTVRAIGPSTGSPDPAMAALLARHQPGRGPEADDAVEGGRVAQANRRCPTRRRSAPCRQASATPDPPEEPGGRLRSGRTGCPSTP